MGEFVLAFWDESLRVAVCGFCGFCGALGWTREMSGRSHDLELGCIFIVG